jgi:hypothetical protein
MAEPFSSDFLTDCFNKPTDPSTSAYAPEAVDRGDGTHHVSVLAKPSDPTSGRRVWERTVAPNGATTSWAEVPPTGQSFV